MRARSRICAGTVEDLFYAALELRCGIEARMSEYLEVWDHISKKKKKGWRIIQLARNVEEAFKIGNRVVRWSIRDKDTGNGIICLYYTPVTTKLKNAGQKLGRHLHAMKAFRAAGDPLWEQFRVEVNDVVEQLIVANTGTLLGPPLLGPNGNVDMKVELPSPHDHDHLVDRIKEMREIKVKISYLNTLPRNLEREAHVWTVPELNTRATNVG